MGSKQKASSDQSAAAPTLVMRMVARGEIFAWDLNPRKYFDEGKLDELAASVKAHGILEPIVLRPRRDDAGYLIVMGERRWRAAQVAGLAEIPAIIREDLRDDDATALELATVENDQREDVSAIERAQGYSALVEMGRSVEQIAEKTGRSVPYIRNTIRLLGLPEDMQGLITEGKISGTAGRDLLPYVDRPGILGYLADLIQADELTVAQLERLTDDEVLYGLYSKDLIASLEDAAFQTMVCSDCRDCRISEENGDGYCLRMSCFHDKQDEWERSRATKSEPAQPPIQVSEETQQQPAASGPVAGAGEELQDPFGTEPPSTEPDAGGNTHAPRVADETPAAPVLKTRDLDYRTFTVIQGVGSKSIPEGCREGCAHRVPADHYGNPAVICRDPKCHQNLQTQATKRSNKQKRAEIDRLKEHAVKWFAEAGPELLPKITALACLRSLQQYGSKERIQAAVDVIAPGQMPLARKLRHGRGLDDLAVLEGLGVDFCVRLVAMVTMLYELENSRENVQYSDYAPKQTVWLAGPAPEPEADQQPAAGLSPESCIPEGVPALSTLVRVGDMITSNRPKGEHMQCGAYDDWLEAQARTVVHVTRPLGDPGEVWVELDGGEKISASDLDRDFRFWLVEGTCQVGDVVTDQGARGSVYRIAKFTPTTVRLANRETGDHQYGPSRDVFRRYFWMVERAPEPVKCELCGVVFHPEIAYTRHLKGCLESSIGKQAQQALHEKRTIDTELHSYVFASQGPTENAGIQWWVTIGMSRVQAKDYGWFDSREACETYIREKLEKREPESGTLTPDPLPITGEGVGLDSSPWKCYQDPESEEMVILVRQLLGEHTFKACRVALSNPGANHSLRGKGLEVRRTPEEAQADLDAYAASKGWKECPFPEWLKGREQDFRANVEHRTSNAELPTEPEPETGSSTSTSTSRSTSPGDLVHPVHGELRAKVFRSKAEGERWYIAVGPGWGKLKGDHPGFESRELCEAYIREMIDQESGVRSQEPGGADELRTSNAGASDNAGAGSASPEELPTSNAEPDAGGDTGAPSRFVIERLDDDGEPVFVLPAIFGDNYTAVRIASKKAAAAGMDCYAVREARDDEEFPPFTESEEEETDAARGREGDGATPEPETPEVGQIGPVGPVGPVGPGPEPEPEPSSPTALAVLQTAGAQGHLPTTGEVGVEPGAEVGQPDSGLGLPATSAIVRVGDRICSNLARPKDMKYAAYEKLLLDSSVIVQRIVPEGESGTGGDWLLSDGRHLGSSFLNAHWRLHLNAQTVRVGDVITGWFRKEIKRFRIQGISGSGVTTWDLDKNMSGHALNWAVLGRQHRMLERMPGEQSTVSGEQSGPEQTGSEAAE